MARVGCSPAGLNSIFSFPVVRIADEHLRQNGVGPNKTCANAILPNAILPKGHNQSLIESGAEIEASPELSNLAEETLQPIEPSVGFHQILSLAGDSGATAQEGTASADELPPSSSEAPAVCCEQEQSVAESGVRHTQNDDGVFMNDSRVDTECEPANDLSITPSINRDGAQASKAKSASRGVVTKTVTTPGPSQQMSFDWS